MTQPLDPHPPRALQVGLRGATALTRAMGRGRYLLADGLGTAAFALSGTRRRRATAHHHRLDPALDDRAARRLAHASFREFARNGVDFLWANGLDRPAVLRASRVAGGPELVDAARALGGGGVLALTHFGNWDMAANIAWAIDIELTTVMADTGPRSITDLVVWARGRNHLEVYTSEHAARGLLRALRRNRMVAILSDVPEDGPTVDVDYCGGPVPFSAVPAWLALRTGAPLIPTACWREDGRYVLHAIESFTAGPGDDVRSLMQRVAATIEPVVRRHPEQWYPFRPVYSDEAGAVRSSAPAAGVLAS